MKEILVENNGITEHLYFKEVDGDGTTPEFSMTRCIDKMEGNVDDPAAFCRWAYDQGKTEYGEELNVDNDKIINDKQAFNGGHINEDEKDVLLEEEPELKKKIIE